MFVRRRPLLRAAVVGGGAYMAGKRRGQRQEASQQAETAEQPGQTAVPAQGSEPTQRQIDISDKLAQLSSLHAQGSLSDAEFAAAKSRLLGS